MILCAQVNPGMLVETSRISYAAMQQSNRWQPRRIVHAIASIGGSQMTASATQSFFADRVSAAVMSTIAYRRKARGIAVKSQESALPTTVVLA